MYGKNSKNLYFQVTLFQRESRCFDALPITYLFEEEYQIYV